ncbi:unnamed protein product [Fusarium graminearum]|uniref:Uncharacterized protein n=1 Tax=Gibberella zeae TaxID=5518 RepID=A0A9N8WQQ4_GIBZA|nr:unnamed protein product [Fusarium graminearum]
MSAVGKKPARITKYHKVSTVAIWTCISQSGMPQSASRSKKEQPDVSSVYATSKDRTLDIVITSDTLYH